MVIVVEILIIVVVVPRLYENDWDMNRWKRLWMH